MGSTHSPRQLVINADDFGFSRGVNLGIIEAAEAGAVTSASMMVNLEPFADAAEGAHALSALSLGLHLNFTIGQSLTAAPSLTRGSTRQFYPLTILIARASIGLVDRSDVARECEAQIDRMIEAGFAPTHLDSHRHIHVHPAFWSTVVQAAASRGVSYVRVPTEPLWANPQDWNATLKKAGLLICSRLSPRGPGGKSPNHFFGISLQGGDTFRARLFALIPKLPAGTSELMTHPGHADRELAERDEYTWQREEELRVLCSPEFGEILRSNGVELANFRELSSAPAGAH